MLVSASIGVLLALGAISAPVALAAPSHVSHAVGYGTAHSADVTALQQFLSAQGVFNAAPTGNFYSTTLDAVKKFQKANNIPATGYVGTMTLAAINGSSVAAPAGTFKVTGPSASTVSVGDAQTVTWSSNGNSAKTATVSVIRKTGSNPDTYALVRTVASAKKDNGSATWVPALTDAGANTYVQIGCTLSAQACRAGISAAPLAVVNDGRYANTASAYQAIEAAQNK